MSRGCFRGPIATFIKSRTGHATFLCTATTTNTTIHLWKILLTQCHKRRWQNLFSDKAQRINMLAVKHGPRCRDNCPECPALVISKLCVLPGRRYGCCYTREPAWPSATTRDQYSMTMTTFICSVSSGHRIRLRQKGRQMSSLLVGDEIECRITHYF